MNNNKHNLQWVYGGRINNSLDSATWLNTGKELCKLGWQVTIIDAGSEGHKKIQDLNLISIPRPEIYLLRQIIFHIQLLGYLLKLFDSIDVILFHTMSAPWLLPLRLIRRLKQSKRPLLVMDTRTLSMPHKEMESWKDRIRRHYNQIIEKWANEWCDGRLAITQRMAQAVNIPPKKLWGVWPSGVDQELFFPAQAKRKWPSPGETINLIYIGALHYERNLMSLCQAVEKANTEGMSFNFILVGEGTEKANLESFAQQTDGRIRVISAIPHFQVPDVLAEAHLGALPFPDEEKFRVSSPIKLFEYMASGLPILATRIACHEDVIGDGLFTFWAEQSDETGLLSALRVIWQNSEKLSEMGHQASNEVHVWTWHESAKKLKVALEFGLNKSEEGSLMC